jgi:hypothetical protein
MIYKGERFHRTNGTVTETMLRLIGVQKHLMAVTPA